MKFKWSCTSFGDRHQLHGGGELLATIIPDGDGGLEVNIWNPGDLIPDRHSTFDAGYTLAQVKRIVEREVA